MSHERSASEASVKLVIEWSDPKTWLQFFGCWLIAGVSVCIAALLAAAIARHLALGILPSALILVAAMIVWLGLFYAVLRAVPFRDCKGKPLQDEPLRPEIPYAAGFALAGLFGHFLLLLGLMLLAGANLLALPEKYFAFAFGLIWCASGHLRIAARLAGRVQYSRSACA